MKWTMKWSGQSSFLPQEFIVQLTICHRWVLMCHHRAWPNLSHNSSHAYSLSLFFELFCFGKPKDEKWEEGLATREWHLTFQGQSWTPWSMSRSHFAWPSLPQPLPHTTEHTEKANPVKITSLPPRQKEKKNACASLFYCSNHGKSQTNAQIRRDEKDY